MAAGEKGVLVGGMKFGVGDDSGEPEQRGPLLPLRALLVADLVPRGEFNAGASAPEAPIRLDPTRFDDLFTKLRPRIAIDVPSVLADGRNVRIDLAPTSLKSFRPDGLCTELPLMRSLLDGRLVLDRLRDGTITPEQARSELDRLWSGSPFAREVLGLIGGAETKGGGGAPRAEAASSGAGASSILDMVDMGGGGGEPVTAPPVVPEATSKISAFIASVAKSARGAGAPKPLQPTEAIGRIEKALGLQIGAILQHPEVRRLEQAWRGVRFLVERTQKHTGIKIDVLSTPEAALAAALERGIKHNASTEPPVTFAVVDTVVDGTAASFARLEALAGIAEANTVPVIVNGSAKLLGLDDLSRVEKLDNKGGLFEAKQQAPWRAISAKHALRWVTIAMNGVLARGPYDKATSRVREAVVKELPDDAGSVVWMQPAWVVASLVLASFRDTGWPCRIVGARNGGIVDNLPVRELKGSFEGEEGVAIPTEAFTSTDSQRDLAKCGVLLLAAAPNSDSVYVLSAPTAYVTPPKRTYDSATTEPEDRLERVSLGDQLFVARLVQFLRALCSKLPASSPPAEAQSVIEAAIWALFENGPPAGPQLEVKGKAGSDGTVVQITVHPRRFLGVALEELSLEMPLG